MIATADRHYIKEFVLARNRELGKKYGVEYAEAFHYIGPGVGGRAPLWRITSRRTRCHCGSRLPS